MRNIRFRGKPIEYPIREIVNNEPIMPFIYGGYYKDECWGNKAGEKEYIIQYNSTGLGYNEFIRVDPKTVGQYTEFKDINGTWIYEGDILKCKLYNGKYENYIVLWDEKEGMFTSLNKYKTNFIDCAIWSKFEVIGNIYDNPELIEG